MALRRGSHQNFSLKAKKLVDDTALAQLLNITYQQIWWVIHERNNNMYKIVHIPKRSGKGTREICKPCIGLKVIQRKILHHILNPVSKRLGLHVGAYIEGRGIVDVAKQHVKKAVVVSLDLRDFFSSIKRGAIRAYLRNQLDLYDMTASLLAAMMTYTNYVPQGAPTSGAICNLVADWRLDTPILKALQDTGWVYTRYSDDITLSHAEPKTDDEISELVSLIAKLAKQAKFEIKTSKTRIMRRPKQQKVLGLVVNDKVGVDPAMYKELRAIIHNCDKQGLLEQRQVRTGDGVTTKPAVQAFLSFLYGKLSYMHSVDPDKAKPLIEKLRAIEARDLTPFSNWFPPKPLGPSIPKAVLEHRNAKKDTDNAS
jgi:RNA-directed DNA polymerase